MLLPFPSLLPGAAAVHQAAGGRNPAKRPASCRAAELSAVRMHVHDVRAAVVRVQLVNASDSRKIACFFPGGMLQYRKTE